MKNYIDNIYIYKKNSNHNIEQICSIERRERGAVLVFKSKRYTTYNKWNKPRVLADVLITRCPLSFEDLEEIGINTFNITASVNSIIAQEKLEELEINAYKTSPLTTNISISLPSKFKLFPEQNVSTDFPVCVYIDKKELSDGFKTFDLFGSNIVSNVYNALFEDFDFSQSEELLCAEETAQQFKSELEAKESEYIGCPLTSTTLDHTRE